MPTVIGVLDHERWSRIRLYCSENRISHIDGISDKKPRKIFKFFRHLNHQKVPDIQTTTLCPNLGLYLFRDDDLSSRDIIGAVSDHATITYAEENSRFEIIKPVSDYEEICLLGDEISLWHHELVGIDILHRKGFTGKNLQIAVLDSGVDPTVAALSDRIFGYASFQDNGVKVGGQISDPFKHGTHVSGIIAGEKFGVAPDASLIICQIAPDGTTSFDRIILALEWLCENYPQLRIINMSVGKRDDPSPALRTVVSRLQQLNKVLVCAIGNDGEGTSRTPGNLPESLGVGAVNINKEVPKFSSGIEWEESGIMRFKPDLVLPGVSIPSCLPGGSIFTANGTSQAAPIASGLAALLLQVYPNLSSLDLKDKLISLCRDLPVPPDRDGHGLPDATQVG